MSGEAQREMTLEEVANQYGTTHSAAREWRALVDERDSLRAQLTDHIQWGIASTEELEVVKAQLAAAQRVPEDAELDALVTRMRRDGYIHADKAIDAITGLRRRVTESAAAVRAELAREPDQSFADVLRDIEARLALGTLYTAERELLERSQNAIKTLSGAVARAARGAK